MNLTKNEPVIEGTVIKTSNQFQGKGQMGNSWFSEPGKNLALSVVLKPQGLNGQNIYMLNMALALAARDFVAMYCSASKVKWPNDIYVQKAKVAGLLIENTWKGSEVQYAIVGLGINVNQDRFPAEIPNPTSLFLETGQQVDLEDAYEKLIWRIEQWYLRFRNDPQKIKEQYLAELLYFEELRTFTVQEKSLQGRIVDVSEAGKLVVETEQGLQEFGLKEIAF